MINPTLSGADFYKLRKCEQNGFKKWRIVTVPKNTLLFKMTKGAAEAGQYGITPWWSAVKPFLDDQEGALGRYQQAVSNKVDMTAMVRLISCVCLDWNDLDNYVQVELQDDARVFWGTFAPMPKFSQDIWVGGSPDGSGAATMKHMKAMQLKEKQAGFSVPDVLGGQEAWQMFIPGLKEENIKRSGVISGHDMQALGMALGFL